MCDPTTGVSYLNAPSGTACATNANECTGAFTCNGNGACGQAPAPVVDDGNPCTGAACGDNSNKCATTFVCDVSAMCQTVAPPVVDDGNVCTTDACAPGTGGVTHTPIVGCDPNPTTGGDYETRASLLATVKFSDGGPATGYTVTAYDDVTTGTPRADAVVTEASDGSFRVRFTSFPTSEADRSAPHRIALKIESPSFLPVYRMASVHPGTTLNLGTISVVARDTKVTVIDAAGGTATDSQGLVEVQVPPGAVSSPTPVRITPFKHRADLPFSLPDVTLAGYAMQLEPEGTQFAAPVTVRVTNWRNMPTTLVIPVGVLDPATLRWKHLAFGTWDGQKFAYTTTHFSVHDMNPGQDGDKIATISRNGMNRNHSAHVCGASTFGVGNGSVRQSFPLPGVQRRGREYAVGLNYDSMLAYGSTDTSAPPGSAQAGSPSGVTIAGGGGVNVTFSCVPKGSGGGGGGGSASCVIGGCTLGGGVAVPAGTTLSTKVGDTSHETAIDPSQNSVEFNTDIPIDLPQSEQNVLANSGYSTASVSLLRGGVQCVGGGNSFGVAGSKQPPTAYDPGTGADATLVATVDLPTLAYHRHTSPFGIGWGISGIGQVFKHPSAEEIALVTGEGDQELFYPRARTTQVDTHGFETRVYALDPVTHEVFRASRVLATIDKINPADASATPLLSGVTMDAAPHTMSIGYVAGVRHFLLALDSQLLDVDANGSRRTLLVRGPVEDPNVAFMNYASSAAIVGEYAYYTKGDYRHPVLYRFHLTVGSPAAEIISLESGGDTSTEPAVPASGYTFGDVHGLAPAIDGGLYVADRLRNLVFELKPDGTGAVSGTSALVRVVGNGMGSAVRPVGVQSEGIDFSIAQPGLLFNGPDNVLWIFTVYGAATYDPISREATWLVHDKNLPDSEIPFSFYGTNPIFQPASFVPVGPLTIFGDTDQSVLRIDVDLYSSETDPTRTISYANQQATLTDTTRDVVESYDTLGRLLEQRTRAGDPIVAFTYAANTNRIVTMVDPTGSATTFHYSGGLLDSVTDAAGRTTTIVIDGRHDLTSFTEQDGQTWTFTYENHRIKTKASPEGDTTTYTYRADGSLASVVKPAGETLAVNPGFAQSPTPDASGHPTFTGSYDDAHGVRHTVTLDQRGRILAEQYTADGIVYTVQHERPASVGSGQFNTRPNRVLARETRVRVNGLVQGYNDNYDDLGRWISDSNGDSNQYAPDGRVKSFYEAPGGDQFLITRDAAGRIAKIAEAAGTNPTGHEAAFTYRADGLASTSTVHGVTTTYGYDDGATANVSSTSDTIGRTSALTYDAAGNVKTANDGATTWTFEHDGTNRLVAAIDQLGNRTALDYVQRSCGCSEASLLTSLHTPDLAVDKAWAFAYGAEGRLASLTDPEGRAETYGYEPTGELKSLVDRNGHTTTMTHDQLGRVLSITDPLLRAHARAYTAPSASAWAGQDVLSGSSSGSSASTDFTKPLAAGEYQIGTNAYDVFAVGSDNHTRGWANVEFYRDATFALSYGRTVDAAGRTTLTKDRPAAQLTSATVLPTGSGAFANVSTGYQGSLPHALPATESWPEVSGVVVSSYNTEWDLTFAQGSSVSSQFAAAYTYTRDVAGRVTNIHTHANDSANNAPGFDADQPFTYYPNGLLHTSPQGTFTYDARGLVQTRVVQSGTYQYEYDVAGRNTKLTYPDLHVRLQQYDPEGRISSRCYQQPDLSQHCYTAVYDAVGNPVTMTDPEGTDTIQYDALDRVALVTRSTGQVEQYSYNALGALKTNAGATIDDQRPVLGGTGTAGAAIPATYNAQPITVDGEGKITSLAGTPMVFDHRGQITSAAGTAYKYDSYARIVENVTASRRYTYDGANRTGVWGLSTAAGRLDTWVYDGVDHPLEHFDTAGNRQYYELDLAGNVRRLRAPNGVDLGGYRYTAFGQQVTDGSAPTAPQGVNALPVRWKGRWLMYSAGVGTAGAVELYDMRARWWWPQGGVFVSVDDFGYADPTSTLWAWPGQNPLRWSDPSGHFPLPANPSGLGPGWVRDLTNLAPNSEKYVHSSGDWLRFDKGQPGKPGWGGKDHWHHSSNPKGHLKPGSNVPDPPMMCVDAPMAPEPEIDDMFDDAADTGPFDGSSGFPFLPSWFPVSFPPLPSFFPGGVPAFP
jgi:RHS repeat-associated protein